MWYVCIYKKNITITQHPIARLALMVTPTLAICFRAAHKPAVYTATPSTTATKQPASKQANEHASICKIEQRESLGDAALYFLLPPEYTTIITYGIIGRHHPPQSDVACGPPPTKSNGIMRVYTGKKTGAILVCSGYNPNRRNISERIRYQFASVSRTAAAWSSQGRSSTRGSLTRSRTAPSSAAP